MSAGKLGGGGAAYNHFLHLVADTHTLHHLNVLQAGKNLMLNLETRLYAESCTLLDGERLGLELVEGTFRTEVNDNIRAAFDLCRAVSKPEHHVRQ